METVTKMFILSAILGLVVGAALGMAGQMYVYAGDALIVVALIVGLAQVVRKSKDENVVDRQTFLYFFIFAMGYLISAYTAAIVQM